MDFSASAVVSNPLKNSEKAQETIFHDFILKMTKHVGVGVVKKQPYIFYWTVSHIW